MGSWETYLLNQRVVLTETELSITFSPPIFIHVSNFFSTSLKKTFVSCVQGYTEYTTFWNFRPPGTLWVNHRKRWIKPRPLESCSCPCLRVAHTGFSHMITPTGASRPGGKATPTFVPDRSLPAVSGAGLVVVNGYCVILLQNKPSSSASHTLKRAPNPLHYNAFICLFVFRRNTFLLCVLTCVSAIPGNYLSRNGVSS